MSTHRSPDGDRRAEPAPPDRQATGSRARRRLVALGRPPADPAQRAAWIDAFHRSIQAAISDDDRQERP